jgi:Ca2+-binding EF-hand superfamily protein
VVQANTPLLLVSNEPPAKRLTERLRIAREILARYDKDQNQKLSRAEVGWPRTVFDRLDTNKDGELDFLELLRWEIVPPDVEAVVHLGQATGKAAGAGNVTDGNDLISLTGQTEKPAGNLRRVAPNALALTLDGSRINLVRSPSVNTTYPNYRPFFQQQFKALEQKKGFVTKEQLKTPQFAYLRSVLEVADRDGDGKLTEKELNAWLDLVSGAAGCLTMVILTEHGRGLFDILDANQDGRLSVRELRNARARLAEYDREGRGGVRRQDLTLQYQVAVNHGGPNSTALYQLGGALTRLNGNAGPAAPARGPLWFRKMDKNGDGDVSEREFLGPREAFRRIDTDGDGLISVEEAERADAWLRARLKQDP